MRAAFALPPLVALIAGCAAGGSFPSLAPRAVERELAGETAPPPAPAIADDPALAARIAEQIGRAREGDNAFDAAFGPAQAAAAGAGAAGSDGWIAAQVAISKAEAARAPTVAALAELDALRVGQAPQPTSAADLGALTAAVADVQAIADRQHSRLEALKASLNPV